MAGKIERRGNRYSFMVDLGRDPATGKRLRKRHSGYRTKQEARRAQIEIEQQRQTGMYVSPTKLTVREYLEDQWLPAIEGRVKPATVASYRNLVAGAMPHIGALPLQSLSAARLNAMYAAMLREGGRARNLDGKGKGRPLSPRTVSYTHAVLRKAMNDAVKWSLLIRNPVLAADPPKATERKLSAWDDYELRRFLEHVDSDRLRAAWILAAMTGLRRGEVLGLRYGDLDLERGRLWVTQTLSSVNYEIVAGSPKTASGRREVALDPESVRAIVRHAQEQEGERQAFGPGYADDHDLVFRREDGRAIHPELLSTWFDRHVKAAGLSRIPLHGLRHTHATLALKAGVPVHVVSRRLGHASIAITLSTYSHVLPGMDQDAANMVASMVFGEVKAPLGHQIEAHAPDFPPIVS